MPSQRQEPAEVPLGIPADGCLRVCYDLNVFYRAFLDDLRARRGTVGQRLVDAARRGMTPLGPMQLVTSLSMTTHLARNLEKNLGVPAENADAFADALNTLARLGLEGLAPLVFAGPTRFTSVVDPDLEDSHVLETANAGGAHVLVTADPHFIGDRLMPARTIRIPGYQAIVEYRDQATRLLIAKPEEFVRWWGLPLQRLPLLPPKPTPRLQAIMPFRSRS